MNGLYYINNMLSSRRNVKISYNLTFVIQVFGNGVYSFTVKTVLGSI